MSKLTDQHCISEQQGLALLDSGEIKELSKQLSSAWQVDSDTQQISRSFKFANYYETLSFVNAVAWVAHQQDHHPDMTVGYNRCAVVYTTHAVDGLSINDFVCAAKIDALTVI